MITDRVRKRAVELADDELPAYVYDLADLESHAAGIRSALSNMGAPEILRCC